MVQRLGDRVWWFDLGGVNAYLVDDGGPTLVDAGLPWHGRRILGQVSEAGFRPADVERVLVTHYDADHVGGLAAFDWLDATIYVGAADAPIVRGTERPRVGSTKGLLQRATAPLLSPPANPVEPVREGDAVGSFTVYETPGHTPGHVAYVSEELSVGFLGDAVVEDRGRLEVGPRFLAVDAERARASVRDLSERAPAFERVGTGHGVPFVTGGKRRLDEAAATIRAGDR